MEVVAPKHRLHEVFDPSVGSWTSYSPAIARKGPGGYVPALSEAVAAHGWSLVQPLLSSSGTDQDVPTPFAPFAPTRRFRPFFRFYLFPHFLVIRIFNLNCKCFY